ncbi:hypothetical protein COO02_20995, partial [Bacillus pseudomycoides]
KQNIRSLFLLIYTKLHKKEIETSGYALHVLEEGDFCWSTVKIKKKEPINYINQFSMTLFISY